MTKTTAFLGLAVALVLGFLFCRQTRTAYQGEYIVPVRVHLLRAGNLPAANCELSEADIRRIFAKVNAIWLAARIRMTVESVLEEQAEHETSIRAGADGLPLESLRQLRPTTSTAAGMLHVYYVHRMPSNGITQGLDAIFVRDTAVLRPVPGGIDEPLPRVTAHELGHAFNLGHRESVTNLMASGTTAVALNDDEIAGARATVDGYSFVRRAK